MITVLNSVLKKYSPSMPDTFVDALIIHFFFVESTEQTMQLKKSKSSAFLEAPRNKSQTKISSNAIGTNSKTTQN